MSDNPVAISRSVPVTEPLQSQKNDLFRLIASKGLQPSDFYWAQKDMQRVDLGLGNYIPEATVPELVHEGSGFSIVFDLRDGSSQVIFSPGRHAQDEQIDCKSLWPAMRTATGIWLDNLKREIEAPDLWAIAAQQREQLETATKTDSPNTPFAPQEQEYIATRLDEIKTLLVEQHKDKLEPQQVRLIDDQFHFLKQESKTQGRRTWILMALGTVLNVVLTRVDPAAAHDLLNHMIHTFVPLLTKLLASGAH